MKYLDLIYNPKYRIVVFKLRATSHNLEMERGCYKNARAKKTGRVFCVMLGAMEYILSLHTVLMKNWR